VKGESGMEMKVEMEKEAGEGGMNVDGILQWHLFTPLTVGVS